MTNWYIDSEVEHYETFRPTLEMIVSEGKLRAWIEERLLHDATWGGNGVPMGPAILPEEKTRYHHDPEPALSAVWYFILTGYGDAILDKGITLTANLETERERAKDLGYIESLSQLFLNTIPPRETEAMEEYFKTYEGKIKEFGETLLRVIMSQGIPDRPLSHHFGEEAEERVITLYRDVLEIMGNYPKENIETVRGWFTRYVEVRKYPEIGQEVLKMLDDTTSDTKP